MIKLNKFLFYIILIIVFSLGFLSFYMLTYPTDKVIYTWKQDNNYKYDSSDRPTYLSVVEDEYFLGKILFFTGERKYYIYVGKDSGKPIYGHTINYSFNPEGSDIYDVAKHIKKSKVIWLKDGVSFEEISGHKIFIPKTSFGTR